MAARLYRLLLFCAAPLVRLRLVWRARREPAYGERQEERFGVVPSDVPVGPIWFHAVSAGETIGIAPLVHTVGDRAPELPLLVTTMTPTGSAQVRERLGDRVAHCYAPYDFAAAVERFYARVQPRLLILMETELWPNLLAAAKRRRVPVALVNARLSERSARGYGRFPSLTQPMLDALTLVCCQYPAHGERFCALGLGPERLQVTGNLKFDQTLPNDTAARCEQLTQQLALGPRWLWIAASTHEGEDEPMLDAHRALLAVDDQAVLLLVPRHPVRCDAVLALARARSLEAVPLSQARREGIGKAKVVIGDSMGELLLLYALAKLAFVGGSLIEHGGHNPIEPALAGTPMVMGPSRFNFAEVCALFEGAGALVSVADGSALAAVLKAAHDEPARFVAHAAVAREVVAAQRGVNERLLAALTPLIEPPSD